MNSEHGAKVLAIQLAVINDQEPDLRNGCAAVDRCDRIRRSYRCKVPAPSMSVGTCIRIFVRHNQITQTRGEATKCRIWSRAVHRPCGLARWISRRRVIQTLAIPPSRVFQMSRTWKEVLFLLRDFPLMSHFSTPLGDSIDKYQSWATFGHKHFRPSVGLCVDQPLQHAVAHLDLGDPLDSAPAGLRGCHYSQPYFPVIPLVRLSSKCSHARHLPKTK